MATPKYKIKRGDTVQVVAGKDKGKTGRVLSVLPVKARVVVEGVNLVKKHQKPTGEQAGQVLHREAALHISNVALWNVAENRRVKVGYGTNDTGQKVRVDRKTGQVIDA